MIRPADIASKQFATTRIKEGYVQDEVDDFLDRVEVDYASALGERDTWQQEAERLKRVADNVATTAPTAVLPMTPVGSAEKILVAAQKTADLVEADANAEAGQIRAAARAEADNVRANAEVDRQRILNQLEGERASLEEAIEILKSKRSGYKSWLRSTLAKIEEEEAQGA